MPCRQWHLSGVLDQIQAEYGDQVRYVWRDYPVVTVESPLAAEAGQCAYDQDRFWEYHAGLYANFGALDRQSLKGLAAHLGMDAETFNRCLDSRQNAAKVAHSQSLAEQRGFSGPPGFLINDTPFVGPPSYAQLKYLIDQELLKQ